jgi:hypothetical protein
MTAVACDARGAALTWAMPDPAYVLSLEPREHYLRAHVSGPEDSVEVSIAYWPEVAAACRASGARRLLVVEELEGNARPSDMEAVVDGLIQLGFQHIRVAYVDATEDASLLVSAEIRVQMHGFTGRVFRREAEAERWLLADLPPPEPTA